MQRISFNGSLEFHAYVKRTQVSRECLLVPMVTPQYYAFFVYTASAEIRRLHSKQKMVIVNREFVPKQSHEIWPWLKNHVLHSLYYYCTHSHLEHIHSWSRCDCRTHPVEGVELWHHLSDEREDSWCYLQSVSLLQTTLTRWTWSWWEIIYHLSMKYLRKQEERQSGMILHGGIDGNCPHAPWSLPWCPWNAPVEIYNFPIGCP